MVGIKIGVDNEDDRDLVIASALKLLQNPLEITAFQLFTIDNSLLFSVKLFFVDISLLMVFCRFAESLVRICLSCCKWISMKRKKSKVR